MAKQLIIRGVSEELGRRLTRLSRDRGQSVNTTARSILEEAVGMHARKQRLKRYATWSASDLAEFDRALADQRVIDDDLWQQGRPRPGAGPRYVGYSRLSPSSRPPAHFRVLCRCVLSARRGPTTSTGHDRTRGSAGLS